MEKSQQSIHPRRLNNFEQYRKLLCRYCDSKLEAPFLDLGLSPLANSLVPKDEAGKPEFVCPLALTFCHICGLVQLSHVVPPNLMFSNYLYVSSTTQTFQKHFAEYAKTVREIITHKSKPLAIDIGSNDGLLVSNYRAEGMEAVGIEPAKNLSDEANKAGIQTINRYFDEECVNEVIKRFGRKADVISGNNVFAHIDDVQAVCKNVSNLLSDEGIFVIEFPYLVTMCEEMFFDMIYHEHLSYISVFSLDYLVNRFGLKIFTIQEISSHGGSLRVFMSKAGASYRVDAKVVRFIKNETKKGYRQPETYQKFAEKVYRAKQRLLSAVDEFKRQHKSIAGYGAPAKATTLINFCGLDHSQIEYVVDDNPLKQNRLVPGAKIPIVPSSYLSQNPPSVLIIFAWNFASEIVKKIEFLRSKDVQFFTPLPEPKSL